MSDIELADLRSGLELARTPAELTKILDVADAMADRAGRYRRALLGADLVDAARAAYRIGIDATFARLEAMCRIADQLPERGEIGVSRTDTYSTIDYGISRDTASSGSVYRDQVADLDLDELRRHMVGTRRSGPSWMWEEPTAHRLVYQPPAPVDTPPAPEGRYRTIVIDPPWEMTRLQRDIAYEDAGPSLAYPTMSVE